MAPLYKRYIPPKSSATPAPSSQALPSKSVSNVAPKVDEPLKKRKRERTDEEIAERKAKKLRKKGIDPATVFQAEPAKKTNEPASSTTQAVFPSERTVPGSTNPTQGEFAHIKNAKKRHKLEKEARKARKAAERGVTETGPDEESRIATNGVDSPDQSSGGAKDVSQNVNDAAILRTHHRSQHGDFETVESSKSSNTNGTNDNEVAREVNKQAKKNKGNKEDFIEFTSASVESPTRAEVQNDTTSQPKKRRHRLEAVLEQARNEAQNQPPQEEDHLRKHGGVMSKFQKAKESSEDKTKPTPVREENTATDSVLLDLAPLPQPEKAPSPEFVPDVSAIPEWLANPTIVSNDDSTAFEDMKLEPDVTRHLSALGFNEAMPVQRALIPLLLPPGTAGARFPPATETLLPDIAVGSPTGSGKTIAYLVPIIESLKKTTGLGKLRALIIVPTRELVVQVAAVAESLTKGSRVSVEMATGTGNFKDEQAKLVKIGRKYDPLGYQHLISRVHRREYPPTPESEEYEEHLEEIANQDVKEEQRIQDAVNCLVDHVPTYASRADVLVATPGRLLEHMNNTLGFSLSYLKWLVLDEADKLIDQQNQDFLEVVNHELERPRREDEQDAREVYLRRSGYWDERRERRVRKVVLSATMTRDISKLVELKLKRPRMILVRGREDAGGATVENTIDMNTGVRALEDGFELPPTLTEYALYAGDGSEKPLFLAQLLRTRIVTSLGIGPADPTKVDEDDELSDAQDSDNESSVDSPSSSHAGSEADQTTNGERNNGIQIDDEEGDQPEKLDEPMEIATSIHPDRAAMLDALSLRQSASLTIPTILIFTSSTESANRLAHLLKALLPDIATCIHVMNKSKSKFPKAASTDPIITISTDRAARGLDAIGNRPITHVLQYDVPRSATSYIHRVGRTARAGRHGEAWTLYTKSEARWFLNEVSKSESIKRRRSVEKVEMDVEDVEMRERLSDAIADIRDEVYGRGGRKE